MRLADLDALARADESGCRTELVSLLSRIETDLPVLSDVIAASYFSHLQTSRHLGSQDHDAPRPEDERIAIPV